MIRRATLLLTTALLVLAVAVSPSRSEGVYAGLGYLDTHYDVQKDVEGGWKIFAGWNASEHFGVEGSVRDMGKFTETSTGIRTEFRGYEFSARGILPIGDMVEFYGKLGISRLREGFSGTASGSLRRTQAIYGLGVGFNLERVGFRAEWERFDISPSLESFSLGAYYRF